MFRGDVTFKLTEHDEGGRPLLVSGRVGGVLAGVAAGVGHFQVINPDGRVLQAVVEEDDPVLEGQVGETLSVHGVENGDVVPLTIDGLPYPRHLETELEKKTVVIFSLCGFTRKKVNYSEKQKSNFQFKVGLNDS